MINALKKHWREISKAEPGKRFQARHRLKRKSSGKRKRPLVLSLAIALLVAGTAMLFVPGPGSVLLIIGAAFLAEESLFAALVLDKLEVQLRKLAALAARTWRQRSTAARAALMTASVALVAGAAWAAYSLIWR